MKKRFLCLFIIISMCLPTVVSATEADTLGLSAKSAVMIDADSKSILYEKNARIQLPMASTTKIMTALVVLEKAQLDHEFKVSAEAVGTEGTSAYLKSDDTMTVEAALYALLLQSANDAAVALAIEIGGSVLGFVDLMNRMAMDLDLSDTCFKNPSGLPCDGHYTTAYDLACLSAVALENEEFLQIVSTKSKTVTISGVDRTFVNHNRLLSMYEGVIGVKTGFTKESGRCLVGACERNDTRLVTVTLSASNDWEDHKKMFDYGFANYRSYTLWTEGEFFIELPVAGSGANVLLTPDGEKRLTMKDGTKISVRIEAPSLLTSPIDIGEAIAIAVFEADGKEIYRTPLKAVLKVN